MHKVGHTCAVPPQTWTKLVSLGILNLAEKNPLDWPDAVHALKFEVAP